MKEHATPEDYEHLGAAIGHSIHTIMSEIMDYVEDRCPELREDSERRLEKFGRVY